jgi:hypothetical protein
MSISSNPSSTQILTNQIAGNRTFEEILRIFKEISIWDVLWNRALNIIKIHKLIKSKTMTIETHVQITKCSVVYIIKGVVS